MNYRSSAEGQNNILSIVGSGFFEDSFINHLSVKLISSIKIITIIIIVVSAVTMICFRFCNDANFTIGNKYLNTCYSKILALHVIDGGMLFPD